MGGKRKPAQRTKNNVRPSSSGRSAELLNSSPSMLLDVSRFSDNSLLPLIIPGVNPLGTSSLESNISPEFQLVVKKMKKKDSVTRYKALQEFVQLLGKSDLEEIKIILPVWSRLYSTLALDIDHKVRDMCQEAHRIIVNKAGRNIAPSLKQFIGPWFLSAFDSFHPAAQKAVLSFEEAFVPNKRTEALLFCHLEILSFIEENVIIHTPSTLSNPGICPMDEMVAKYERVVVASLNAYAQLLEKIPVDALKDNQEIHKQKLVSSNAFWNYSKHKNSQIRRAWFGVIIALCQHAPYLLSDHVKQVSGIVFVNLSDKNSTVLPVIWDAALELMVAFDDCWKHINFNSVVLPKLWSVLLGGAYGNAVYIFPKLLPFLSEVPPPENEAWYHDFYLKFFQSIIDGLQERCVQQSAVESKAVINALFECLQYVCKVQINNTDLCSALFRNQVFPLLESALLDESMKNNNSVVFTQVSYLLHHWQKLELVGTPHPTYVIIVKESWKHLEEVCKKPFMSLPLDEWKLSNQLKLLSALNSCFNRGPQESSQVQAKLDTGNNGNDFFEKHLGKFISVLIREYYTTMYTSKSDIYLLKVYICKILTLFGSKQVLLYLLDCIENDGVSSSDSFLKLWNSLISSWLNEDEVPTDLVLNLWCVLLRHVDENERKKILKEILGFSLPKFIQILYWCFFVDSQNDSVDTVTFWATLETFQSVMISISKDLTRNVDESESREELDKKCQVLSKFISPQENIDFVTDKAFTEILKNFNLDLQYWIKSLSISACDLSSLAHLVNVTTVAFSNSAMVCNSITAEAVKEILLNVFKLCCLPNVISNEQLLLALKSSWQRGLNLLFNFYPDCFSPGITSLAEEHAKCIVDILTSSNVENIQNLSELTISYITFSVDFVKADDGATESNNFCMHLCNLFIETAIRHSKTCLEKKILNLCLYSELINGKDDSHVDLDELDKIIQEINSECSDAPSERTNEDVLLSKNQFNLISCEDVKNFGNILAYIVSLTLRIMNIPSEVHLTSNECVQEDGSDHLTSQGSLPENAYQVTTPISYGLCCTEVCKSFKTSYSNTPASYSLTERMMEYLVANLQLIVSKLSNAQFQELLSKICSDVNRDNFIFCDKVLSFLSPENQFKPFDLNTQSVDLSLMTDEVTLNVSLLRTANSCLLNEASDDELKRKTIKSVMNALITSKSLITPTYAANMVDLTSAQIILSSCACKFLNLVLRYVESSKDNEFCPLSEGETDFMLISLTAWIQSLSKTIECISFETSYHASVPIFISEICGLFETVSRIVNVFHPEDSFSAEWRELFMADVHLLVANAWKCLIHNSSNLVKTVQTYSVVKKLSHLIINVVNFDLVVKDDSDLRKWSKFALSNLENSSNIYVQITSYYILLKLIPMYIKYDLNVIAEREADEEIDVKDTKIVLNWFKSSLDHTQSIVCMMLSDLKLGDTCSVAPLMDSYSFTLAYLSLWSVIFEMVAQANSQLRYQYTFWIRDENLIPNLMPNMIRLLPASIVHTSIHDSNRKRLQQSFIGDETLLTNEQWDSTKLSSLVCGTYCNALRRLPALIRQWWTEVDNKEGRVIEDITARYVSSMLCEEELKAIREANKKPMENFIIKIRDSVREVIATYTVEEIAMEVSITLAQNHPLGMVRVESTKAAMSSQHWHNWLKQLTIFLTHQNGSIWDGLMSWKSNIDKRFEGVEECYICFSILHVTSYELPRKNCRTCHKKFHLHCLYKWFMTSNKSTCPTCRNLF